MSDREGKDHPRADPRDQQAAREHADARQRNAVTAEADVCRKPGDEAERQPDGCQQPDEQEVVPRGRNRVHVQVRHEEHHSQRNEETADIQSPLARLAKNDEDECCIDDVIRSSHAPMIGRRPRRVVGARVEARVDSRQPGG